MNASDVERGVMLERSRVLGIVSEMQIGYADLGKGPREWTNLVLNRLKSLVESSVEDVPVADVPVEVKTTRGGFF